MDTVRIFVASDPRMEKAEKALERSVEENTTGPWEITWMRAGDPGWVGTPDGKRSTWNIGREPQNPYPRRGWGTDFTCFRWAIPELCNFEGRAIYQDVDQIDVGDMRELFEWPTKSVVLCSAGKTCVMMLDCAAFKRVKGWPTLEGMKRIGEKAMYQLRETLTKGLHVDKSLPRVWNQPDRWTPGVKVLHYTNMRTQPWKPWPERFDYPKHPDPKAEKLFWEYYGRATA